MTRIDTPTGWVRRVVAVIVTMTVTMAALVGASAPASAEACSSSSGVSVVVDFEGATGGVQSACVATGANTPANEVITAAGFALTWVQRQPGFICQVNGVPAGSTCVNTPPPDAYWGLFWSDGKDGAWHYADVGASGLEVPDGGYIGLAWQTGTRRAPAQAATAHATATPTPSQTPTSTAPAPTSTTATPKPTSSPTKKPTTRPSTTTPTTAPTTSGSVTTTPTAPSETPTATDPGSTTPTESPTGTATESPTVEPSQSSATGSPTTSETTAATETPTDGTVPPEARTDEESSRVPTWLTLTILVMLLLAIGMSAYAARRRTRG